jgi:2-dehydro-3-deoxygluconokinase
MRQILPYVDIVIGNEEDAEDVLKIKAGSTDVNKGLLAIDRYPKVASKISQQFPNIKKIAFTLRESISATHNNWGGMLFDAAEQKTYFAPLKDSRYQPYQIQSIVDRVGGGDSFAAALIYALTDEEFSMSQKALSFAVASSCLAHSIDGDFNYTTREEIESLMGGSASGRVIR